MFIDGLGTVCASSRSSRSSPCSKHCCCKFTHFLCSKRTLAAQLNSCHCFTISLSSYQVPCRLLFSDRGPIIIHFDRNIWPREASSSSSRRQCIHWISYSIPKRRTWVMCWFCSETSTFQWQLPSGCTHSLLASSSRWMQIYPLKWRISFSISFNRRFMSLFMVHSWGIRSHSCHSFHSL